MGGPVCSEALPPSSLSMELALVVIGGIG